MEAAGTKLNLVVLDACRNNPFGGRGLRSSDGGLAQMRAPEGTLISFATQPGNVALDGEGNSPYTRALAATIRKSGLDIFQTFNEVGLAVKHATGGSQQPWVSSSPIDGSFYFVPPAPGANAPAAGKNDDAAQAWAATRDTTSLAVIETFIQQYGGSIYGPFARARRDELKNSKIALAAPKPAPETKPAAPRLTRAEVEKLFEPFNLVVAQVEKNFVEPRSDKDLYVAAGAAMRRAFPPAQQISSAAPLETHSAGNDNSRGDLTSVYDTALAIMNQRPSGGEDAHIVEVAINGMLASLDPHSGYMDANAFRDMQTQTRGTFGGVGLEVTMADGLVKVVSPIDGAPAAKAGILANDVIVSIDDAPVQGLTLNQAVEKMRGPVNSRVKLKIVRQKLEKPFETVIVRDTIRVVAVRSRIEGGDVGYIRITTFNELTDFTFRQAIADITGRVANDNLKGYIIDLRNNPGGLLSSAVSVSDDLLERGEIVSTRGRNGAGYPAFQRQAGRPGQGQADTGPGQWRHRLGIGNPRRGAAGQQAGYRHRHAVFRQGLGPDHHSAGDRSRRLAADHGALFHAFGQLDPGQGYRAGHRGAAGRTGGRQEEERPAGRSLAVGASARARAWSRSLPNPTSRLIRRTTRRSPRP